MKFITAAALLAGAAVAAPAAQCPIPAAITHYSYITSEKGIDFSFTLADIDATTNCTSHVVEVPSQTFPCQNNTYSFMVEPADKEFKVRTPEYKLLISKGFAPGVGVQAEVEVPVYCHTAGTPNIVCDQVEGTFDFPIQCGGSA